MALTLFTLMTGLLSVTTTSVSGVEGQTLSFRCAYPQDYQQSVKYFSHVKDNMSNIQLIWTDKHNQWEKVGRFSLYDNTTGAFVIISVDGLVLGDSGTYWCVVDISLLPDYISVIQLSVGQGTVCHVTAQHLSNELLIPGLLLCVFHYVTKEKIRFLVSPSGKQNSTRL